MTRFFTPEFNQFAPIKLSQEEENLIDQTIINALQAPGELIVKLLTDDELNVYNEELTDDRLKKLNARLRQFVTAMSFQCEGNQIEIKITHLEDVERLRKHFLYNQYKIPDITTRIQRAAFSHIKGDLFIDAIPAELVKYYDNRLTKIPSHSAVCSFNSAPYTEIFVQEMQHYDQIAKNNFAHMCQWFKERKIPVTAYFHEADFRFSVAPAPVHYKIECKEENVPQLLGSLELNSCFTEEQSAEIRALIIQLNKEIESSWPYPNKDRKAQKVEGLKALLSKSVELSAIEAITAVELEFPAIRQGNLSTRTANLLDSLKASSNNLTRIEDDPVNNFV